MKTRSSRGRGKPAHFLVNQCSVRSYHQAKVCTVIEDKGLSVESCEPSIHTNSGQLLGEGRAFEVLVITQTLMINLSTTKAE